MYRVHGDKVIRRTNYRKENDIQKYTKILKEDFGNMCGYCGKDLCENHICLFDYLFISS